MGCLVSGGDRYAQLVNAPVVSALARQLGLPQPVSLERHREGDPVVSGAVLSAAAPGARLDRALKAALDRIGVERAGAEGRAKALVFDASGIADSTELVESWQPQRLALTHFGQVDEPSAHLERVRERLREEAQLARELPAEEYDRRHRTRIAAEADPENAAALIHCVPPDYQWRGLDRYWRKRAEREAA